MSLPPNRNLLKEYLNPVYVETGIWRGDSIQQAIDAGFKIIVGIDNDQESIDFCKSRFNIRDERGIKDKFLWTGDSASTLHAVFKSGTVNDVDITFYLDAHWQLLDGTERGAHPFPLLDELQVIKEHRRDKKDTIIIDDLLYLTHPDITGWTKERIMEAVTAINWRYQFKCIANPVINNMLVAWIP